MFNFFLAISKFFDIIVEKDVNKMKYVVFLGDGMADLPCESLGGKTPLQVANKPMMDAIASQGLVGMVKTVPDGFKPGSDVANLSVMGFDPVQCYTGRSPLEAASIGVEMKEGEVSFRCNLVTLSEEEPYSKKTMVDYSADEISTQEAHELIACVNEAFKTEELSYYGGISYRHLLLWKGVEFDFELTPPHDISGRTVGDYLPNNPVILDMMEKSYEILKNHPVNQARIARGKRPANSIWIWGQGTKPGLSPFMELYGKKGTVISAVDLIKGIAKCAQMESIDVPGATGNVDTNFEGKAQAAIDALSRGQEFVYIHVEAADESGHRFEQDNKLKSIELIDEKIIRPVWEYLKQCGEEYKLLVLPDHPTPLSLGTHTSEPVPFAMFDSRKVQNNQVTYDEESGQKSGLMIEKGFQLMTEFLKD